MKQKQSIILPLLLASAMLLGTHKASSVRVFPATPVATSDTLQADAGIGSALRPDTIASGITKDVTYTYDEMGNRISRFVLLSPVPSEKQNIQQDEASQQIAKAKISPRVKNGILHVDIDGTESFKATTVRIYNSSGQQVMVAKQSSVPMDLSPLPDGVYILQVECDRQQSSWKITID